MPRSKVAGYLTDPRHQRRYVNKHRARQEVIIHARTDTKICLLPLERSATCRPSSATCDNGTRTGVFLIPTPPRHINGTSTQPCPAQSSPRSLLSGSSLPERKYRPRILAMSSDQPAAARPIRRTSRPSIGTGCGPRCLSMPRDETLASSCLARSIRLPFW